jgi:hypothetical protein
VTADRAREIAQAYLSRHQDGLFAQPALLGSLSGRELWFVQVGRLGTAEAVGDLAVDAVSGEISDVRIPERNDSTAAGESPTAAG